MSSPYPVCESCRWWQDYTDRVYARIRGKVGPAYRGVLELRRCQYNPPPSVAVQPMTVYTDKDFTCSQYERAPK